MANERERVKASGPAGPEPIPDPEQELQEGAEYSQFVSAIPSMVKMARWAAYNEAISYRDFHVGASAYATSHEGSRAPIIIGGANYKPDKEAPKYCAEMDIIDQVAEYGLDEIIGLVIAGTTDPNEIKDVMGRVTPTLPPCAACRDKMNHSGLITPETIVITVGLDSDRAQVHSFDDLELIYELEEKQAASIMAPVVDLDLPNWSRRENDFDTLAQASPDTDPVRLTRLVLSSTVSLED